MFRLLKLMFWGGLFYFIYQVFTQSGSRMGEVLEGQSIGERDLEQALNEDPGRMPLTGPGRGETVTTEDPDGAQGRHVVGRGVVEQ